ncbi:MAG: hypothetical protein IPN76_27465 [Saprospiraceae bacterium]|nr:hypothetical protein [Saprospiraceae bacterium]
MKKSLSSGAKFAIAARQLDKNQLAGQTASKYLLQFCTRKNGHYVRFELTASLQLAIPLTSF